MWPFDYFKKQNREDKVISAIREAALLEASESERLRQFAESNPPGPELDKKVADIIYDEADLHRWTIPPYSSDPAAMFELVSYLSSAHGTKTIIAIDRDMTARVTMWADRDGDYVHVNNVQGQSAMHSVAVAAIEFYKGAKLESRQAS